MGFFKKNDSPPCITCSHCVAEKEFGTYSAGIPDYIHKCELTPDRSGVFFEECWKARRKKFCSYEKRQDNTD